MHRMHVHPPSPPCASPPPGHVHPPPPQPERLVMSKDEAVGTGQQEKNARLFTCDLIIFCHVSLYIKKQSQNLAKQKEGNGKQFLYVQGTGSAFLCYLFKL